MAETDVLIARLEKLPRPKSLEKNRHKHSLSSASLRSKEPSYTRPNRLMGSLIASPDVSPVFYVPHDGELFATKAILVQLAAFLEDASRGRHW